jgi:hypothetical protein
MIGAACFLERAEAGRGRPGLRDRACRSRHRRCQVNGTAALNLGPLADVHGGRFKQVLDLIGCELRSLLKQ